MTTDELTADIKRFTALVETALEKYRPEECTYAMLVERVFATLDEFVERTIDIDRMRAARPKPGKPKNHAELIQQIEQRLDRLRP